MYWGTESERHVTLTEVTVYRTMDILSEDLVACPRIHV